MTLTVLLRIRHAPHLRPPTCGHIFPMCTNILWSTSGAPIEFSRRTSMPYKLLGRRSGWRTEPAEISAAAGKE